MKCSKVYVGFLLTASIVFGIKNSYAQDFKINDKVPIPIAGMNEERQEEITEANFVEATKLYITEDYKKALDLYISLFSKNKTNAAIAYQIAVCNQKLKNNAQAIEFANKAYVLEPGNKTFGQFLAGILAREGQYKEASVVYKKLFEQDKTNSEIGLDLAATYYSLGDYSEVMKIYAIIEKNMGINSTLTEQKQAVLMKMNKLDDAIKEGDKLIESEPNDIDNYLSQAEFLIKTDKTAKAKDYLDKAQKINPNYGQIHLLKAEIARQKKEYDEMYDELILATNDGNLEELNFVRILLSFFETLPKEAESPKKEQILQGLIRKQPNEPYAYLLLGDFKMQQKDITAAKEYYLKALNLDKANNQLWLRIISLEADLKEYNNAIKHAEEAIELYPNQSIFWYYLGSSQFMLNKNTEAISSFEEAQRLVNDDKFQKIGIISMLAEAYNRTKQHDLSDAAFEEVLLLDPDNDGSANNYAYYLSLRKQNLGRAEVLAEKVAKRNLENASYLDTYGYILFVNGNFEKALEWLDKANKYAGGKNATITEHLADCLFKLGKESEALAYWKKAFEINPKNKNLEKKITEKRYIE